MQAAALFCCTWRNGTVCQRRVRVQLGAWLVNGAR